MNIFERFRKKKPKKVISVGEKTGSKPKKRGKPKTRNEKKSLEKK
jgi:hypothetical protein